MEWKRPESGWEEIQRFSFWKPEPLPPKDGSILPIELLSLGTLAGVTERLLDVPKMTQVHLPPWGIPAALNLYWQVERGVLLRIQAEEGPARRGEVFTISAKSATCAKFFYRLYVQIYEQFGATMLDEQLRLFITPKEFRHSRV